MYRRGRLGVTLRMRDFFQLVQTISFNVGKTARKEPIALPSRVTQVRRSTYKLEDNIRRLEALHVRRNNHHSRHRRSILHSAY